MVQIARHHGALVVADQFMAPATRRLFQSRDVPVRTVAMSAASKSLAFGELRSRIYNRSLELYEHPVLLVELRRLRTQYKGGKATVVSPRTKSGHGDLGQALALAVMDKSGSFEHPEEPDPTSAWLRRALDAQAARQLDSGGCAADYARDRALGYGITNDMRL